MRIDGTQSWNCRPSPGKCRFTTPHGQGTGMKIIVNGQPQQAEKNTSIVALLQTLSLNPRQLVIELNRQILTSEEIANIKLQADDQLEIIHFVGGG